MPAMATDGKYARGRGPWRPRMGQNACPNTATNEFGADLALSADVRPTQGLGRPCPISTITNARPGHPD